MINVSYILLLRAHVSNDSSLSVKNVKVADEGTYICEAENSAGMISSEVTLTVHCKYFIKCHYVIYVIF